MDLLVLFDGKPVEFLPVQLQYPAKVFSRLEPVLEATADGVKITRKGQEAPKLFLKNILYSKDSINVVRPICTINYWDSEDAPSIPTGVTVYRKDLEEDYSVAALDVDEIIKKLIQLDKEDEMEEPGVYFVFQGSQNKLVQIHFILEDPIEERIIGWREAYPALGKEYTQQSYPIKIDVEKIHDVFLDDANYVVNGLKFEKFFNVLNLPFLQPAEVYSTRTDFTSFPATINRFSSETTVVSGLPGDRWKMKDDTGNDVFFNGDLILTGTLSGDVILTTAANRHFLLQVKTSTETVLGCARCGQRYTKEQNYHGACQWHTRHARTANYKNPWLVTVDRYVHSEDQIYSTFIETLPLHYAPAVNSKIRWLLDHPTRISLAQSPADMSIRDVRQAVADYAKLINSNDRDVREYARVVVHLLDQHPLEQCFRLEYYDPADPLQKAVDGFRNPNVRHGFSDGVWQCCGFPFAHRGCFVGMHSTSVLPDLQDSSFNIRGTEHLNDTYTSSEQYNKIMSAVAAKDYATVFLLEAQFNGIHGGLLVKANITNAAIKQYIKSLFPNVKKQPLNRMWVRDELASTEYAGLVSSLPLVERTSELRKETQRAATIIKRQRLLQAGPVPLRRPTYVPPSRMLAPGKLPAATPKLPSKSSPSASLKISPPKVTNVPKQPTKTKSVPIPKTGVTKTKSSTSKTTPQLKEWEKLRNEFVTKYSKPIPIGPRLIQFTWNDLSETTYNEYQKKEKNIKTMKNAPFFKHPPLYFLYYDNVVKITNFIGQSLEEKYNSLKGTSKDKIKYLLNLITPSTDNVLKDLVIDIINQFDNPIKSPIDKTILFQTIADSSSKTYDIRDDFLSFTDFFLTTYPIDAMWRFFGIQDSDIETTRQNIAAEKTEIITLIEFATTNDLYNIYYDLVTGDDMAQEKKSSNLLKNIIAQLKDKKLQKEKAEAEEKVRQELEAKIERLFRLSFYPDDTENFRNIKNDLYRNLVNDSKDVYQHFIDNNFEKFKGSIITVDDYNTKKKEIDDLIVKITLITIKQLQNQWDTIKKNYEYFEKLKQYSKGNETMWDKYYTNYTLGGKSDGNKFDVTLYEELEEQLEMLKNHIDDYTQQIYEFVTKPLSLFPNLNDNNKLEKSNIYKFFETPYYPKDEQEKIEKVQKRIKQYKIDEDANFFTRIKFLLLENEILLKDIDLSKFNIFIDNVKVNLNNDDFETELDGVEIDIKNIYATYLDNLYQTLETKSLELKSRYDEIYESVKKILDSIVKVKNLDFEFVYNHAKVDPETYANYVAAIKLLTEDEEKLKANKEQILKTLALVDSFDDPDSEYSTRYTSLSADVINQSQLPDLKQRQIDVDAFLAKLGKLEFDFDLIDKWKIEKIAAFKSLLSSASGWSSNQIDEWNKALAELKQLKTDYESAAKKIKDTYNSSKTPQGLIISDFKIEGDFSDEFDRVKTQIIDTKKDILNLLELFKIQVSFEIRQNKLEKIQSLMEELKKKKLEFSKTLPSFEKLEDKNLDSIITNLSNINNLNIEDFMQTWYEEMNEFKLIPNKIGVKNYGQITKGLLLLLHEFYTEGTTEMDQFIYALPVDADLALQVIQYNDISKYLNLTYESTITEEELKQGPGIFVRAILSYLDPEYKTLPNNWKKLLDQLTITEYADFDDILQKYIYFGGKTEFSISTPSIEVTHDLVLLWNTEFSKLKDTVERFNTNKKKFYNSINTFVQEQQQKYNSEIAELRGLYEVQQSYFGVEVKRQMVLPESGLKEKLSSAKSQYEAFENFGSIQIVDLSTEWNLMIQSKNESIAKYENTIKSYPSIQTIDISPLKNLDGKKQNELVQPIIEKIKNFESVENEASYKEIKALVQLHKELLGWLSENTEEKIEHREAEILSKTVAKLVEENVPITTPEQTIIKMLLEKDSNESVKNIIDKKMETLLKKILTIVGLPNPANYTFEEYSQGIVTDRSKGYNSSEKITENRQAITELLMLDSQTETEAIKRIIENKNKMEKIAVLVLASIKEYEEYRSYFKSFNIDVKERLIIISNIHDKGNMDILYEEKFENTAIGRSIKKLKATKPIDFDNLKQFIAPLQFTIKLIINKGDFEQIPNWPASAPEEEKKIVEEASKEDSEKVKKIQEVVEKQIAEEQEALNKMLEEKRLKFTKLKTQLEELLQTTSHGKEDTELYSVQSPITETSEAYDKAIEEITNVINVFQADLLNKANQTQELILEMEKIQEMQKNIDMVNEYIEKINNMKFQFFTLTLLVPDDDKVKTVSKIEAIKKEMQTVTDVGKYNDLFQNAKEIYLNHWSRYNRMTTELLSTDVVEQIEYYYQILSPSYLSDNLTYLTYVSKIKNSLTNEYSEYMRYINNKNTGSSKFEQKYKQTFDFGKIEYVIDDLKKFHTDFFTKKSIINLVKPADLNKLTALIKKYQNILQSLDTIGAFVTLPKNINNTQQRFYEDYIRVNYNYYLNEYKIKNTRYDVEIKIEEEKFVSPLENLQSQPEIESSQAESETSAKESIVLPEEEQPEGEPETPEAKSVESESSIDIEEAEYEGTDEEEESKLESFPYWFSEDLQENRNIVLNSLGCGYAGTDKKRKEYMDSFACSGLRAFYILSHLIEPQLFLRVYGQGINEIEAYYFQFRDENTFMFYKNPGLRILYKDGGLSISELNFTKGDEYVDIWNTEFYNVKTFGVIFNQTIITDNTKKKEMIDIAKLLNSYQKVIAFLFFDTNNNNSNRALEASKKNISYSTLINNKEITKSKIEQIELLKFISYYQIDDASFFYLKYRGAFQESDGNINDIKSSMANSSPDKESISNEDIQSLPPPSASSTSRSRTTTPARTKKPSFENILGTFAESQIESFIQTGKNMATNVFYVWKQNNMNKKIYEKNSNYFSTLVSIFVAIIACETQKKTLIDDQKIESLKTLISDKIGDIELETINIVDNTEVVPIPFPISDPQLVWQYYQLTKQYDSKKYFIFSSLTGDNVRTGDYVQRMLNARIFDEDVIEKIKTSTKDQEFIEILDSISLESLRKKYKKIINDLNKSSSLKLDQKKLATIQYLSGSIDWYQHYMKFEKEIKKIPGVVSREEFNLDSSLFEYLEVFGWDEHIDIFYDACFYLANQNPVDIWSKFLGYYTNIFVYQNIKKSDISYGICELNDKKFKTIGHAIVVYDKPETIQSIKTIKEMTPFELVELAIQKKKISGKPVYAKILLDFIASETSKSGAICCFLQPNFEQSLYVGDKTVKVKKSKKETRVKGYPIIEFYQRPNQKLVQIYSSYGFAPTFKQNIPLPLLRVKDILTNITVANSEIIDWITAYLCGAVLEIDFTKETPEWKNALFFNKKKGKYGIVGYKTLEAPFSPIEKDIVEIVPAESEELDQFISLKDELLTVAGNYGQEFLKLYGANVEVSRLQNIPSRNPYMVHIINRSDVKGDWITKYFTETSLKSALEPNLEALGMIAAMRLAQHK
jgi:hypothetical protein